MRSRRFRLKWTRCVLVIGVLATACVTPAEAHKLNVFAYADGRSISGEAYFRGGSPIKAAPVTAFDPAGEILAETTTDDAGEFTFELKFRCDHRVVVNAGEGHLGEYTVSADELPADLSARGPAVDGPAPVSPPDAIEPSPGSTDAVPGSSAGDELLHGRIADIDRQLKGLRKDLDRYQSKLRMQDILGAVGYILGLMGLGYYLGVRRKEKRDQTVD